MSNEGASWLLEQRRNPSFFKIQILVVGPDSITIWNAQILCEAENRSEENHIVFIVPTLEFSFR